MRPAIWHYRDVRPHLMQAGGLISAEEATRRVLILENPGLKGQTSITHSLFAGLQLILPGEVAPAHRHTQSALRFIIEGDGAYTAVDGERTTMHPGDFVITPSWTWHDHGNETTQPMVWLDGLDIPIVAPARRELRRAGERRQPDGRPPRGRQPARYGHNLLPVDWKPAVKTSPVFNYPYARTREALDDAGAQRRARPVPRPQAALRQPGERRSRDADDRRLHAAAAARVRHRAVPLDRRHGLCRVEGTGEKSVGDKVFALEAARHVRRAELARAHHRPEGKRCCSATPTGRCTKSSACGASSAATPDPFVSLFGGLAWM